MAAMRTRVGLCVLLLALGLCIDATPAPTPAPTPNATATPAPTEEPAGTSTAVTVVAILMVVSFFAVGIYCCYKGPKVLYKCWRKLKYCICNELESDDEKGAITGAPPAY